MLKDDASRTYSYAVLGPFRGIQRYVLFWSKSKTIKATGACFYLVMLLICLHGLRGLLLRARSSQLDGVSVAPIWRLGSIRQTHHLSKSTHLLKLKNVFVAVVQQHQTPCSPLNRA